MPRDFVTLTEDNHPTRGISKPDTFVRILRKNAVVNTFTAEAAVQTTRKRYLPEATESLSSLNSAGTRIRDRKPTMNEGKVMPTLMPTFH